MFRFPTKEMAVFSSNEPRPMLVFRLKLQVSEVLAGALGVVVLRAGALGAVALRAGALGSVGPWTPDY